MLIVGGLLGRWFATDATWQRAAKLVVGVWLVFGLGVYTVLGGGLFGQHLQAGAIWHGLTLLLVFGVYGVALVHAYSALVHRAVPPTPDISRREFLRNASVAMIATIGAGAIWRSFDRGQSDTVATPIGNAPAPPV